MKNKAIYCCLAVLVFISLYSQSGAAQYDFSIDPEKWRQVVFPCSDSAKAICKFGIKPDQSVGTVFSVGPWKSGKWSARYQYLPKLPVSKCFLTGDYRTVSLMPFQAAVTITFLKGDTPLARIKYDLSPSTAWKKFNISIDKSPETTEYLTVSLGLEEKTEGRLEFSRIRLSTEMPELTWKKSFIPAAKIRPFNYYDSADVYRIKKYLDNYWLMDPEGRSFYASGIGGFDIEMNDDQVKHAARVMVKCKFNCMIAKAADVDNIIRINEEIENLGEKPMTVFYMIESNSLSGFQYLRNSDKSAGIKGHAFPDPYDPGFREAYSNEVQRVIKLLGNRKWFAGWFADNELSHADLFLYVHSENCFRAFQDFLKRKYGKIGNLNARWNRNFRAYDDIIIPGHNPVENADFDRDLYLFERQTVKKYIDMTIKSIREYDPDRLIASNTFMPGDISACARLLVLYSNYDMIALNLYPSNNSPGLSHNEKAYVRMFHDLTGRPLFISEWSVPALDSGLYNELPLDWSWSRAVRTQKHRAAQVKQLIMELYNMPFVSGACWYCWKDISTEQRRANRGIVDRNGNDWSDIQNQFGYSNIYINK